MKEAVYTEKNLNELDPLVDEMEELIFEDEQDESENKAFEGKEDYFDSIKSYLKEVSQYKLLTFEEEKEFSRRIEEGDDDALNELIQSNLRLVIKIAKSFVSKEYPLIDIIQDGNIGLIRAAQKFDYRRNVRFSTYAAQWIKQMIIRALSQKRRMVRLPYRKEKTLKRIKETANYFMAEHRRFPTTEELSKELGLKPSEVEHTKFSEISTSSLEAALNDETSFSLENIVGSLSYNPYESLVKKDLIEETLNAVDSLVPKEKAILMQRFGLNSETKQTLKSMGELFGISAETVRQIENRTLRKLEESHTYLKEYILN